MVARFDRRWLLQLLESSLSHRDRSGDWLVLDDVRNNL